ncbi:B-box type zinc finger protein ncl-1 isoform X1 [Magallana gigas]|uniref:B-box type zinc finger protein ncl-1 isoform X1 n=1 Tax=Magallana gigas TaxID=29159 RepID=UPI003340DF47
MASEESTQGQHFVECNLCQKPVSFFCRQCGVNLCDSCIPVHVRLKSKTGHDVVYFTSMEDENTCLCESHPLNDCSAYCKTCDVPICFLCVSITHKTHEISELSDKIKELNRQCKTEELLNAIAKENERLQSSKQDLEKILNHTTKQLSWLPLNYKKRKDEVTARGEEWHKLIEETVKKLHQELDDMQKEHEAVLQKQKEKFEEMIEKVDEINKKVIEIHKSKNAVEIQRFKPMIEKQETLKEFSQYSFPTFYECKIDPNYLQTYFGYVEKTQEKKMSLLEKNFKENDLPGTRMLEAPTVTSVIDSGFPAYEEYKTRLYDMAVTEDNKVWMGGTSYELKLFDLQGHLHHTVSITDLGLYLCMYNKQVVYIDQDDKAVRMISDTDTVVTMFTTGDWIPLGVTSAASGDLLVCLSKDDQSKVVRYSSTGTVLQEIQYDSQCQPLYKEVVYITENVNGDIIVTDWEKDAVIAVDRLGIFRFSYSEKDSKIKPSSVATDSVGHVIVTEIPRNKIHMLDIDGRFLRYIIPEGGINTPRAVCILGDGEMMVGECYTGIAKRIKYLVE